MPAVTESAKIRFHTINRATGNRIRSQYIDAETAAPVERDDQVAGYERGEGDYLMLEDEELENVALESTKTIDVDMFVPKESIDWIWYDSPYYMSPDDPVGAEAFSVIRDAMAATGMVGISRVVLGRRERAVMLEPRDTGIVLWTLRYGNEVRDPDLYFGQLQTKAPDPSLKKLMAELISERKKRWAPSMAHDVVQETLSKLIASKKRTPLPKPRGPVPERTRPSNIISIQDALKKSLEKEGKRPRRS